MNIELIQNAHRFFVVCIFVLVKFLNTIKISVIIFYNIFKILLRRTFVKNTHTYKMFTTQKHLPADLASLLLIFPIHNITTHHACHIFFYFHDQLYIMHLIFLHLFE